jgi:hypothetical protein
MGWTKFPNAEKFRYTEDTHGRPAVIRPPTPMLDEGSLFLIFLLFQSLISCTTLSFATTASRFVGLLLFCTEPSVGVEVTWDVRSCNVLQADDTPNVVNDP